MNIAWKTIFDLILLLSNDNETRYNLYIFLETIKNIRLNLYKTNESIE